MSDSEWSAFLSDVGKACESWPHGKYQIPRWIQLITSAVYFLVLAAYLIQNFADLAAYLPWLEGTQPLLAAIMGGLTGVWCLIQVVHASMYMMDLKELRQVLTRIVDDHKDAMRARGIQLRFLREGRHAQGAEIPGPGPGKMHYVKYCWYQWFQLDVIEPA